MHNAVINDKESALLAQKVIVESFGEDALYFEAPTTGGEDFSYYTQNITPDYLKITEEYRVR